MVRAGSKYFTLCSPPECMSNSSLFWHTGNFAASKVVASGSSKPELQKKSREKKSFSRLQMKIINLKLPCISPESNGDIDRML